jgi:hypothetical protein
MTIQERTGRRRWYVRILTLALYNQVVVSVDPRTELLIGEIASAVSDADGGTVTGAAKAVLENL